MFSSESVIDNFLNGMIIYEQLMIALEGMLMKMLGVFATIFPLSFFWVGCIFLGDKKELCVS